MDKPKSAVTLTPEQESAVMRRSSLLVSAAAGSGKTRVLTSRLSAYVTDESAPCDIDDFLVITYTNAAAAQLRAKISEDLSRISGQSPQNKRLRRQLSRCYHAQIGTIHSYCSSILRENCHYLGLSPDFIVGDEDKCRQLKSRAMDKLLEEAYERIGSDEGLSRLVESIGAGRDDSRLMEAVNTLHEKLQSHAFPDRWASEQMRAMELPENARIEDTPWASLLLEDAKRTVGFWLDRLGGAWRELLENEEENELLLRAYGESITETLDALETLGCALERGWDEAHRALPVPFRSLNRLTSKYTYTDRKQYITGIRNACKDACEKLEKIFSAPSEKMLSDMRETGPAMKALLELALEFDRLYAQEKRRYNLLDFSDLEHFAVALLCDKETLEPTALARDKAQRFREILVDEYQDVNAVQELIIQCLSRDGKNIFMVGDIKQSIYSFRLADPSIFIKKLEEFPRAEDAGAEDAATILLKNNFRSDRRVLSACNSVFSSLMSKRLGDINYNAESALYPPETAPEGRGEVSLTVIAQGEETDEGRPSAALTESEYVARQIKELVEGGSTIVEDGVERPLRYGDIAILIRYPGKIGSVYKRTMESIGVPVAAQHAGGFFAAPEIMVMTSFLTVIDNPHNDVALTAVLNSPAFGFTPDELAQLRASDKDGNMYTALLAFSKNNPKGREFLELLNELRALSCDLSVYELLIHIYERLSLKAVWTAVRKTPDAAKNLSLYSELAASFENGAWRGLQEFLSRIKKMEERNNEPASSGQGGDGVSILSIHKSKGLEFPVVFLCDTAHLFVKKDLLLPVLIHPELGLGAKITDKERDVKYPGLPYHAIKRSINSEILSEEMRVLYVALTRAKEKLFISCCVSDPEKFISGLSGGDYIPPDPEVLCGCSSLAQWLVIAALNDSGGSIRLTTAFPEAQEPEEEERSERPFPHNSEAELCALREALSFRYPYEYAASLPSKITATALTHEDDGDARLLLPPQRSFDMPDFMKAAGELSPQEKGIATHTVMQFIDFQKTDSSTVVELEVERIFSLGLISGREKGGVDTAAIVRFFASETGRRILHADSVLREFRFSVLVPAEEFYPGGGDEKLLLQGVVDCCIEENGLLTVIDYKTDFVTPETLDAKAAYYKPQLDAYALALERITGKRVREKRLAFLRAGLEAVIND